MFGTGRVEYEWKVPTTGASGNEHVSQLMIGASGECTWTTSGWNSRSARRVWVIPAGKAERFPTDPFTLKPTVRPTGTR